MLRQLGSMPYSEEYIAEDTVGHWVIEKDPDRKPRMYVDDVMLGLIGLSEQTDPESTFEAWLAGIDENYMDSVMETERMNVAGIRAEVQYPWHYPDGHTILIRCEGIRNYAYEGGIRTEGRHRNITDLTRLQKEAAVISALASDFECVDYILIKENKADDVTISFRTSIRMKMLVPTWDQEPDFHSRMDSLIYRFGLPDEIETFRSQINRDTILAHLRTEPAYFVNVRASVEEGKIEYFQFKFMVDRDAEGNVAGIVVGLHSIDDEMREELELREEVEALVSKKTKELRKKNETLSKINEHIISTIGEIVEGRDEESGKHIGRVSYLTRILAMQVMKDLPEYGLSIEDVINIAIMSPLHDVGKIKIPDSILLKPGKLTPEEFEIMKTHCDRGCEILEGMTAVWSKKLVKLSMDICRCHHEKWDGNGYPRGLRGDEIPIAAQIVSVADAYDALVSERCYKKAYSHDEAYNMIMEGQCGQYSEKLLSCFTKCRDAFAGSSAYISEEDNKILSAIDGSEYISNAVPLLEEVSQAMPGGFFIYQNDADKKLIYFNDLMVSYFGCSSREEFIEYVGNSFKGIVHPEDYRAVESEIENQVDRDGRRMDHVVYRIKRKDGAIRWIDDYGRLLSTGDMGEVFFVFAIDFTETYLRRPGSMAKKTAAPETTDTQKAILKDLKILLVDDSDMARELGCELLEEEGAAVTQAASGAEAIDRIKESMDYDLILMDLVMPVMNGVSAIREINSLLNEANKQITIICLTSEGSDMQIQQAMDAGAYECLYKPLNISELSKMVITSIREKTHLIEKRLEETIELANTDTLTRVNSIIAFADRVAKLSSRIATDEDARFVVILSDCDNLKKVNDTYGHDVGDMYIRNMSSALCDVFGRDKVFRIGGDEFVAILEDTSLAEIDADLDDLVERKYTSLTLEDIKSGKAGFSYGAAEYEVGSKESFGDVMKRADMDLYNYK